MSNIEVTYTLDDTTESNYIYDTNKIEFTASGAKLKTQWPDGTCGATYTSNINLDWGDGVLTGTGTGSPTVSGGKLDLTPGGKYVDYDAVANADSQQVGAIRFKLTPNYSGTPGTIQRIIAICQAAGNSNNLISLSHSSATGGIVLNMLDQSGGTIISYTTGAWSPTSGVEYEFELNWDVTAGATRLFIDGTQFGTTQIGTGTRSSSIGLFRIGANYNATGTMNGKYDDPIYFSTVQHTANYTSGYNAFEYYIDNPTIEIKSSILADGINSWAETDTTTPSGTTLKYILPRNPALWWDGGAWSSSDETYAKSNTQADIATNLGALDISSGNSLKFLAFLNSDGSDTPIIKQLTLDYDYFATISVPTTCVVYGNSIDLGGVVLANSTISFNSYNPFRHGDNIVMIGEEVDTAANGFFDVNIIETATVGEKIFIEISHTVGGDTTTVRYDNITIPNQANISIGNLLGATLPNDVKYYKEGTATIAEEDPLYIRGTFRAI